MKTVVFPKHSDFRKELERRVHEYFQQRNLAKRDNPKMYFKASLIIVWALASYITLVFLAPNVWAAVLAAISLALALVGIGFNIQHDANHQGFSKHGWVNRLAGMSLDILGASSYFWKVKHNLSHHTYTNIPDKDADLDLSILGRVSTAHRRFWFHRYQHLYLWFLYAFVHMRYMYGDFHRLIFRRVGGERVVLPKRLELLEFTGGKALFFTLAFVLPALFHPLWVVLAFYSGISIIMGLLFSIVFQLAHMVTIVEHPENRVAEHEFAIHQIKTTADFATQNRLVTWFLGGLNFQREHHLFPGISHVYYPAIAVIVRTVCREQGVRCPEHPSFWAAVCSHYRFLKRMGRI